MAHVGVLRALLENNIRIDCIAGTSAGSMVGGAFAAGMSVDQIAEFGRTLRWRDIGRVTMSRLGVQSNERLEQYLRARMPVARFEELQMPFAAVATELKTGAALVMRAATGRRRFGCHCAHVGGSFAGRRHRDCCRREP
jgi:NTE family protein